MTALHDLLQALWWYVRQVTGEARWDKYLAECAALGDQPMTRRDFERRRDRQRERAARGRCC